MSYRRRHRWFRRMVLGLAFSVAVFAGRTSVAAAKFDEGVSGSRHVSTGGWSGEVDMQSGVPVSAGIPEGDEQFIDPQSTQVIPYLSHGLLTQADANAAAAEAIHDPFLTDVFVRPGESLGGPDGEQVAIHNAIATRSLSAVQSIHDPFVSPGVLGEAAKTAAVQSTQSPQVVPYLSHGILTDEDARLAAAAAIKDPNLGRLETQGPQVIPYLSHGILTQEDARLATASAIQDPNLGRPTADEVALANAVQSQQTPYMSLGRGDEFTPGATDFPAVPTVQPDFPQPVQVASSDDGGPTVEWDQAVVGAFAAFLVVLGLGLALGRLKRPKLAGL